MVCVVEELEEHRYQRGLVGDEIPCDEIMVRTTSSSLARCAIGDGGYSYCSAQGTTSMEHG
jgi:hypothetical protein